MKTKVIRWVLLLAVMVGINISSCSLAVKEVQNIPQVTRTTAEINNDNIPPATIIKTITPTPKPIFQIDDACWPVKPFKDAGDLKGSLVFRGDKSDEIFAWDLSSFHTREQKIETKYFNYNLAFSRDGNKVIAFFPYESSTKLLLISADQTQIFSLPNSYDYDSVAFLLDGSIRLGVVRSSDRYNEDNGFTDVYYILNPSTGEFSLHSVFLPNLALFKPYALENNDTPDYPRQFAIQYSPDMRYVIYRAGDSGNYSLLDLTKNKVVWDNPKLPPSLLGDTETMPSWKPDSSAITFIYKDKELARGPYLDMEHATNYYSISLDGDLSPLTQFKQSVVSGMGNYWDEYVAASYPSWFPNGRYLVFQMKPANQDVPLQLYIWDDQERVAFKPCVQVEGQFSFNPEIIWSFDRLHFLLTLNNVAFDGTPPRTTYSYKNTFQVIFDIPNKTIFELPDKNTRGEYSTIYGDGSLAGWVNWEIP